MNQKIFEVLIINTEENFMMNSISLKSIKNY